MVTVPGALMDAATSAGVLRTTESLNPELLAAVLMALMILAAKPTSGLERVYVDSQLIHAVSECTCSETMRQQHRRWRQRQQRGTAVYRRRVAALPAASALAAGQGTAQPHFVCSY
jgi:hypothetical protein